MSRKDFFPAVYQRDDLNIFTHQGFAIKIGLPVNEHELIRPHSIEEITTPHKLVEDFAFLRIPFQSVHGLHRHFIRQPDVARAFLIDRDAAPQDKSKKQDCGHDPDIAAQRIFALAWTRGWPRPVE